MRRFALVGFAGSVIAGLALAPLARPLTAQDDDFPKKRAKAIERGIDWLKKQQAADGSFDYEDKPFSLSVHMKNGSTALALYALLKAGVLPNDPVVNKGFEYIHNSKLEQVYAVGCILLALEARANWEQPVEPEEDEEGEGTHVRPEKKAPPKKGKTDPRDKELAGRCVDFIVKTQSKRGTWRYQPAAPTAVEQDDSSNPQYALLGCDAAERMGIGVPKDVYQRAVDWFVTYQEKDGPDVTPFSVPGADLSYKELKKIEKEMKDKIHQIEAEFKGKKSGDVNKAGHTEEDERRTVAREAAGKIIRTAEKLPKMKARGWAYAYYPVVDGAGGGGTQGGGGGGGGGGALPEWKTKVTGGMTTSGLACLLICKAHLDGSAGFEKSYKGPVNKAMRDAAAWLAHHYSVNENPEGQLHHYYYMYGLERAGMIGLVPNFGEHDWYADGSRMFVKEQKAEGQWNAGMAKGTSGPVPDTCFALLFLARGTTPVVRIPTRTATGGGAAQGGGGARPQPQPQPQPPAEPKGGDE